VKHLLLRAPKGPFEIATPERTLDDNLIGNNSGNLVFIEAAHRLLATHDTTLTPDRFRAHELGADHINERYDAYVVPLANAFRVSFEDNLIALTRLIERLTIPVIVLGVGAQATVGYQAEKLDRIEGSVRAFVKAVLARSPSIGVRGEFTQSYLQGLGFRDVEVIGCPSMFLHGERLSVEKRVPALDRESAIALNVSPYVKAMAPIVESHVARYPNLRYIAQDIETLGLMLHGEPPEQAAIIDGNPTHLSHPLFAQGRASMFVDPWPWFRDLATVDFAFGTRIHGNIAALLAGTPSVVFAHDSRTLELARYFEIPHHAMPDVPPDVDAADLYAAADYGPLLRGHAARFATFTDYLARHGLHHVFEPGEDPDAFTARVAATTYPPAVTPRGGSGESRVGRLGRRLGRRLRRVAHRRGRSKP
jgi:Polysaccharide pyruvyl transferase